MGRWLAIDYGKARCGVAVTDPARIIANGLTTVPTRELMAFLQNYFREEDVERVIMGKPTQTNGVPSENMARVKTFAGECGKKLPQIPLVCCDGRLASVLAHRAMIDGGLPKMQRRNKALVDELSATILLQSYMESVFGNRK